MANLKVIVLFGGAPSTGGSGGGGGPNKNIYPTPEPQAILGMNSSVVYGANVQIAFPYNFQLAFGSNLQICINPSAMSFFGTEAPLTLPPFLNEALGSGLGGNMQFTLGSSANFVMGQVFDINLGPRRITLDVHDAAGIQGCMKIWAKLLIPAVLVFLLAYGASDTDDLRAGIVMTFQVLMQVLMFFIMDTQGIYSHMDAFYKKTLDTIFSTKVSPEHVGDPDPSPGAQPGATLQSDAEAFGHGFSSTTYGANRAIVGLLFATVFPILLEIGGEIRLHDPQPSQEVDNAGGAEIGTVKGSSYDGS